MDVGTILLLTMAALFLLALVGMVFSAPLRLAGKALLNTLLGLGALILLNATSAFTGLSLGVNLFNALVVGILGSVIFIALLLYRLNHGRKAVRLGPAHSGGCAAPLAQRERGGTP